MAPSPDHIQVDGLAGKSAARHTRIDGDVAEEGRGAGENGRDEEGAAIGGGESVDCGMGGDSGHSERTAGDAIGLHHYLDVSRRDTGGDQRIDLIRAHIEQGCGRIAERHGHVAERGGQLLDSVQIPRLRRAREIGAADGDPETGRDARCVAPGIDDRLNCRSGTRGEPLRPARLTDGTAPLILALTKSAAMRAPMAVGLKVT